MPVLHSMRTTQIRRNKGMEEYKDISRGLKMLLDKAEEMGVELGSLH